MSTLRRKLNALLGRGRPRPSCDTCAFVEFFRSNGDGQVTRLHGYCRCPAGPFEDQPIPAARRCDMWQKAAQPPEKPKVADPTLTV